MQQGKKMTAKEYLNEVNNYRRIIRSIELQIEEARHQATQIRAIVYDKDRVQTSPSASAMDQFIMRLDELGDRYVTNLIQYRAEIDKRSKMINALPNPTHAQILRLRYINGLKWKSICVEMGYTFRHTTKLHGYALQAFAEQFKDVLE